MATKKRAKKKASIPKGKWIPVHSVKLVNGAIQIRKNATKRAKRKK